MYVVVRKIIADNIESIKYFPLTSRSRWCCAVEGDCSFRQYLTATSSPVLFGCEETQLMHSTKYLKNQNWRHFYFVELLTFYRSQSASASLEIMALYKWFYFLTSTDNYAQPKCSSSVILLNVYQVIFILGTTEYACPVQLCTCRNCCNFHFLVWCLYAVEYLMLNNKHSIWTTSKDFCSLS